MIRRILGAVAALTIAGLGGLTLAAPAQATQAPITVTQATCEDGGAVTVSIADVPYLVSSGVKTAGLAVRVDGEITYTLPVASADGAHVASEAVVVGPFSEPTTVEYRWFAGPERTDIPAWDLSGDWVATVVAREAEKGTHWDAGDVADFVPWLSFDATGCVTPEAPTLTPAACDALAELTVPEVDGVVYSHTSGPLNPGVHVVTASPDGYGWVFPKDATTEWEFVVQPVPGCPGADGKDGEPGQDGADGSDGQSFVPAGQQLPVTGAEVGILAALGLAAVGAGVGLLHVGRRRRITS